jgi:hypothetical protein
MSSLVYRIVHSPVTRESWVRLPGGELFLSGYSGVTVTCILNSKRKRRASYLILFYFCLEKSLTSVETELTDLGKLRMSSSKQYKNVGDDLWKNRTEKIVGLAGLGHV